MTTKLSLLLAVPLALCLMGAATPSTYTTELRVAGARVVLIEMGGCQYVLATSGGPSNQPVSIVHHAACTNPAHTVKPSTP